MPGVGEENFNPGELLEDGDGFMLDFGEEDGEAGMAGGEGGSAPAPGASAGGDTTVGTPTGSGAAPTGTDGAQPGGATSAPQYVPVDKFNEVVNQLAELRGTLAAQREQQQPVQREPEQPAVDQNAQVAAFRKRLKDISAKLYDPDTAAEGVEELLTVSNQLAMAQANQVIAQRMGSTQESAVDLIVENFVSRKEKNDDLAAEIVPLFEAEVNKYRPQLVGRSRAELVPAMEALWKGFKADVLEKKFTEAKERAKKKQTIAPKLGGGSATGSGTALLGKNSKLDEQAREFARKAGIPEDQLDNLFGSEE